MSKPVIPEGRTGTPNVSALRRSRLTKAPDQDFVVQIATRDQSAVESALGVIPSPPAPHQSVQQLYPQTPAQTAEPQQQPHAPAQQPVQSDQFQVQAPQQPAPPTNPSWQQGYPAPAQPAPQPAPQQAPSQPQKPKVDEAPKKKKENYLQDAEDAARVRRAFNRTKHLTGIENWSEFVCNALMEKAAQLETLYNGGEPFDGSTKAPMGRPAAAE